MGLYLALLPFDNVERGSRSVLECTQRRELFDEIMKLPSTPVPSKFYTYLGYNPRTEETCYGDTQETPYGEQVTYVLAKQLLSLSEHKLVLDNPINKAIWAYLSQLPPESKIALYWH